MRICLICGLGLLLIPLLLLRAGPIWGFPVSLHKSQHFKIPVQSLTGQSGQSINWGLGSNGSCYMNIRNLSTFCFILCTQQQLRFISPLSEKMQCRFAFNTPEAKLPIVTLAMSAFAMELKITWRKNQSIQSCQSSKTGQFNRLRKQNIPSCNQFPASPFSFASGATATGSDVTIFLLPSPRSQVKISVACCRWWFCSSPTSFVVRLK